MDGNAVVTAHPHELDRVRSLGQAFLDTLGEKLPDDVTDVRIDQFALVAIVSFTDEDGDGCELPAWQFETSRPHVQQGIIDACLTRLRARLMGAW